MSKSPEAIRTEFIQFFADRGHTPVPSSSLVPADDPTLLFTNAGMNQFKDVFLGTGSRPYTRAVDSQKCIRAGGKHNDLEDVGHDTYHHTFFEMLGNWSFGDYFKAEAIEWAWDLLTKVWGVDKSLLYATVFGGDESLGLAPDDEAAALWSKITGLPAERILTGGVKDNFWEMGEIGPCGPCSEIHIDLGAGACDGSRHGGVKCRVNVDRCERFIELWNLVFIQFNRLGATALEPLPARHVDTGMGFERMCKVLVGEVDNYATDVFAPLLGWLGERSGIRYGDAAETDVALRVVADHARACSFAIADGVLPSNEGRGYVIRRILRRAARFGRKLGEHDPFLHGLVPVIADQMGRAFPEIAQRAQTVADTIREEEESFNRTLDRGLALFARAADKVRDVIGGEVAFELYATYGFPIDLTQLMAAERSLSVDMAGYEREMAKHKEISSAGGGGFQVQAAAITGLPATDDSPKYDGECADGKVLGWVIDGQFVNEGELHEGQKAAVVVDRTCFYGESGGQVGDTGMIASTGGGVFEVEDTKQVGDCVLHVGLLKRGALSVGAEVDLNVTPRMDIRRNHTGTHLLNWALREVLGGQVDQAGSVVDPERLRFDFTHPQAVSVEQLAEVEDLVNRRILADEPVHVTLVPLAEARKFPGVRAVFGEKYPDPVRVVSVGVADPAADADESSLIEFCGGTHLDRTSQIGLLKIVSEESVARGVRRITAVTGHEAVAHVQRVDAAARSAASVLRVPVEQIGERVEAMQQEIKQLRKRLAGAAGGGFRPKFSLQAPEGKVLVGSVDIPDPATMRSICDQQRQKGAVAVMIGAADEKKVTLIAAVAEELVTAGKAKAGDWVGAAAKVVGGGGGGKPTMAQAGGKDPSKLPEALEAGKNWIAEKLGLEG